MLLIYKEFGISGSQSRQRGQMFLIYRPTGTFRVQKSICRSIEVQRIIFHNNQRSPSYHADRNPLQMLFCRCFSMLRSDSHPRRNTTWSGPFHFYTTDSSDLNESLMCFSGVTKSTARTSHSSIQISSWENENERRATANCNDKCQIKYPAAWFFLKEFPCYIQLKPYQQHQWYRNKIISTFTSFL